MLTVEQRHQLDTVGHVRIPGVVDRAAAAAIADRIWAHLERRGVLRADPSTWPSGLQGKLQGLRQARVFDVFATPTTDGVVDELLGAGAWKPIQSWGPALVTFPEPGPWVLPHKMWHFDLPGRGDPDHLSVARFFGYASDVEPGGGATVIVEGSHELVRRLVVASPTRSAGSSATLRRRFAAAHPWFRALLAEGGDRVQQFMVDGDEIDGVRVRVVELTADAGDVVTMLPWTMHSLSMNCAARPRLMVTHSVYRTTTKGVPAWV